MNSDVYVEWLIKRKTTLKDILLRAFSILLIIACVIVFLLWGIIGLIGEMIACYLAFYMFKWTSIEYEYCYVAGDLSIDKVMGKYKRKRCATIDMNLVEVVAPRGHEALRQFENSKCGYKNYTSRMDLNTVYVMYYRKDSELIKVEFEPNSKMIDAMELQFPRKVYVQK